MKTCLLILVVLLSGCASFTEEYWREKYESMTAEEIEAAKDSGELVTVCNLTDCIHVWVY